MNDDTISRQSIIDTIHKTICGFFDVAEDDSEEPISEKDKLLLEVNKAICNGIKELPSVQPEYTEQDMREQFNAGYACGMHAAQPESKREWYMKGYRDAQANIVQCEDCKWRRNQNGTMAWIPCRALVTPDDFYCKYAERKEQ